MDDDDDIPTETSALLDERNNADRMERGNIPKAEPEQVRWACGILVDVCGSRKSLL